MDVGDIVQYRGGRKYEVLAKTENGRPIVGTVQHGNSVIDPFIADENKLITTTPKETP